MSEIAEFLHHGAEQITPKILEGIHKKLPALKLEFAEIDAPKFPHLAEQLEFLADVVEDYVEEADDALPLVAVWCFHFDGVFIGATAAGAMMLTMGIAFVVYLAALGPMTDAWGLQ